ncbi:MAG TPA: tetratricopeptide repeat protein [Terriglobales bacterium]|nr:tetratricopeptide repeat protein [Terriglobales bacterium]
MASLSNEVPEPEQNGKPPTPGTPDNRDAAAVLTPAPISSEGASSDTATLIDQPLDAATVVDLGSKAGSVSPYDAPTMIDAAGAPTVADISPATPVTANVLLPGMLLGRRYEILALLGEGGMGAVYKAMDRELNRPVALKVIRPELAKNKSIIDRFKQELLLARQITHRNVVRIYDLGEADGVKFITMEFIEGEDLRSSLLRKSKLTPEEAVDITQQVCRALEAAHSTSVIHRDLKPQNIMRDETGRVVVMDFGLARTIASDGMTKTGALVGTVDYMSPEQALGQTLDQRSDLYTVGLIMYELLTGKMPFAADSAIASLVKRTQQKVAPISDHDQAIPRSVSNIVSKCLERDLKLRYQSAAELLADLEAWQGKRAGAALTFQPKVGPWGQTMPLPLIATIVTVLVLAISGYLLRGKIFGGSTKNAGGGPQVSLAILPFRNVSGDPSLDWIGADVAEMLRTDMGQSASLQTVPSGRVTQIFHDLRIEPDAALDPDTLRRVAEFTSADRLLWGQFTKAGGQIRIEATLEDVKTHRTSALQVTSPSEEDLPNALQRLAEAVQNGLQMTPQAIKDLQAKSLKPSSQSVQALRYYTEGMQLSREAKNLDAVKQFEAAIKEDPNFALAYSKLAVTYAALDYGDKAQESSRKALDLSDKVAPQEKLLIQAQDAWVTRDYAKAISSYENLDKILPNDFDIQYSLARACEESSVFDKGRAYYDKLLARDPKNVDILFRIGWLEDKRNNAQGSLDYLNRALTGAVQVGNEEEKAAILEAIASAYQDLNKLEDALRNYQQALDIMRRLGGKGGIADTLNNMAQAQALAGKLDDALKSYSEALQLRREIGDKLGTAATLLNLGNYYETRGQYDEALKFSKEALPIFREMSDPQDEGMCLSNIGLMYLDKADYENAMSYFQQALPIRQKVGAPNFIADTIDNIAETYARTGQYSQAQDNYLKALDLYRKAGDKDDTAFPSWGLSRVFQYQGRYGAAVTAGSDALKTYVATGQRGIYLAQIEANYGNSLSLIGRGSEAQKSLDEALDLAREQKNNPVIAQIMSLQGDRFFYQGDFRAAKNFYEQASQMAAHTTDHEQILVSKFNVAKANFMEGRSRESIAGLQALAQQADESGLKYLSVEASLYLAQALIDNKDYARARRELDTSLRNSEKFGLQASLAKSHFLLGEALRLSGNQTDAAIHYAEAQRIVDDIHKEAHTDDVMKRSDLAAIYQESAKWQAPKS